MWDKVLDYTQRLLNLSGRVDKNDERTAEIAQELATIKTELQTLTEIVRLMRVEQLQDRERAAYERENLLLRLENTLLKQGRGELSPAPQAASPTGGAS